MLAASHWISAESAQATAGWKRCSLTPVLETVEQWETWFLGNLRGNYDVEEKFFDEGS